MDRFPPKGDRHEALILRELAERGVASLLDVGCGYGRYLRAAARCPDLRLQRVCGVDISPTQVEHARSFLADHPEVELVVSPATRLPLPDLSFDAVLTFGLMIHLRTREVDEFLREARRVCSGWGLFVESSNNLNEPHRNPPYYFAHDYEAVFARHGLGIEKRTPVNLALQEYLYVVRLTGHAGAG
jgi:SAM-dependent methyltransferase